MNAATDSVVDERTAEMTMEALRCRTYGHRTEATETQGRVRRAELAPLGQMEETISCDRCGRSYTQVIDIVTGEVVSRTAPKYPEGYLIKKEFGGRLLRQGARQALMSRRGYSSGRRHRR